MKVFWQVALAVLFASHSAADVSYQGLKLSCATCEARTETHCQSPYARPDALAPCKDVALDVLLHVKTELEATQTVKPKALRNFILQSNVYDEVVREAFRVLLITNAGQVEFRQGFSQFRSKFGEQVLTMLADGRVRPKMAKELVRDYSSYSLMPAEYRGGLFVAARLDDAEPLFASLPVTDLERAIEELSQIAELSEKMAPQLAKDAAFVARVLENCQDVPNLGMFPAACAVESKALFYDASSAYLKRAIVSLTVSELQNETLSVHNRIELLARAPFEGALTPNAVKFVEHAMTVAISGETALLNTFTKEPGSILAQYISSLSQVASMSYSKVLTAQARLEAISSPNTSASLLLESYVLSHTYDGARYQLSRHLIERLSGTEMGIELQEHVLKGKKPIPLALVAGGIVSLLLVGCAYLILRLTRSKQSEKRKREATLDSYMHSIVSRRVRIASERLETLKYFDLKANATVEELRQIYRKRVQTVHPDCGGSEEEFMALQEHYAKAKACLVQAMSR